MSQNHDRARVKPSDTPGRATAQDGLVLLDGPNGVAVTMTAEAAELTAESLRLAAAQARGSPHARPEEG